MATEKTISYLSSIEEVSKETKKLSKKAENQRALKLAFKKDFDGALEIFNSIENEEMVLVIKKCIELEPIFDEFYNGHITLAEYKKILKKYPDEAKDIVHYKYPNLEFIELKNLEKRFREKIEGIIDDLLSKNTLDSLIEARKVFEKNIAVVKKPYNFNKIFIKTISTIPYSEYTPLYSIEWADVDVLINNHLIDEAKSLDKTERIIKEIKVIDKNRETIQTIIRRYNRGLDTKLRLNYREAKLKIFVREYNKHSFYTLDKKNKISTKIEPFFLQRRIYSIFYLSENCILFLAMLKASKDCINYIPFDNQKSFYRAIIRSVKKTRDYSVFEYLPAEIITGPNFENVIQDNLEEDEVTIRGIVKQLKGKDNQPLMESLFIRIFKKELTFADTKKAPDFNKENSDILEEQYKENDSVIHKMKASRVLFKILAAIELLISALFSIGLCSVCAFAFRKHIYFLAVMLLIIGIVVGIYSFVRFEDIITYKREKRLLRCKKVITDLTEENIIILKKVYLGID